MKQQRAVHRTVLVLDVEGFGKRRPTIPHRLSIRAGLYRALDEAFAEAGTPWDGWYREDRGDGLFVLAPPEVPKGTFVETLPGALVRALRRHNETHCVEERIRLRMALHAGELIHDGHGVAGAAVDHAFRLSDAAPLKSALAQSSGVLALVVSSWFFEEVVRNCPAPVHTAYRRTRVAVKELEGEAWIHVPGDPGPPAEAAVSPSLFMVPTPMGVVVPRRDLADQLLAELAGARGDPDGLVAAVGAGGFGKTTLAIDVCRRPELRGLFPDGVLWATVGENLNGLALATRINDLSEHLTGVRPTLADPLQAGFHLGRLLGERRVLVVIDDVWRPDQLAPFLQGGEHSRRLVTTRNRAAIPSTARRVIVDAMTPLETHALLTTGLTGVEPGQVEKLACATGSWPLLLTLVNSQLRSLVRDRGATPDEAVAEVGEELLAGGPTALDVTDAVERRQAVEATVEASLALLEGVDADRTPRYTELAVFGEQTEIPRDVLEAYWAQTAGWTVLQVRRFCDELAALSLVEAYRASPPRIRLHHVMCAYLRRRVGNRLPAMHAALLDAFRRADGWWALPSREQYLWRNLARHLVQAGRDDELERTVLDPRYAIGKIMNTDAIAYEADLAVADGAQAAAMRRLIARSTHLLRPDDPRTIIESTLANRTIGLADSFIRALAPPYLIADGPLPDHSDPALHRVLISGGDPMNTVRFSPDGKVVVAAGGDGTVRMWHAATGVQQHILCGHTDWVNAVAFSSKLLASGSGDGTIRLWDTVSGALRCVLTGHEAAVESVAFHPHEPVIASAGADGTVRIWTTDSGAALHVLSGHQPTVWRVAFSPDGSLLASAGDDGSTRVWNVSTGSLVRVLTDHGYPVQAIGFSPDSATIVSGARDGAVRLWDVATGRTRHVLTGHSNWVRSVVFSPDGRLVVSASWDRTVRVWDATTGRCVHVLDNHIVSAESVAFTPDGSRFASAAGDGTIHLWRPSTGEEQQVFVGHAKSVQDVVFSPDGSLLASASWDGSVRLWRPASGDALTARHCVGRGATKAVASSPDGRHLAFTHADGTVRLRSSSSSRVLGTHSGLAHAVDVSPDGTLVASGGADGVVLLWPLWTDGGPRRFTGSALAVRAVAFSPDGGRLLSAGDDGSVRLWDVDSGRLASTWNGHAERVLALAWHPGGDLVATAGDDGIVRLQHPMTGAVEQSLAALTPAVNAVALDLTRVAAAGRDGTVRVWDLDAGRSWSLIGHELAVEGVAFSPDGSLLASASRDGTVRLWSATTGAFVTGVRIDGALAGLAWLPDGQRLAVTGARGLSLFTVVTS